MSTPRSIHGAPMPRHARHARRVSPLLASMLAPFCGWSLAQTSQTPPATVLNLSVTALPQGGQVRVGSGRISQDGNLLLIRQSSDRLGIDWQSFDIGRDATVEFRQPGRDSIALNRVLGNDPSTIFGRLVSNGQVFLTNPNGVLFAPGSKVDVGGLVASTLDLSQDDFAAGNLRFEGEGGGRIVADGVIEAESYVALFGTQVVNGGTIAAPGGSVVLASGRTATIALDEHGLLSAAVRPGAAGRIDQTGSIDVGGGRVQISAHSAAGQPASLVNTDGLVRASAIATQGGEIVITGDAVTTRGALEADGRTGGHILVRGGMQAGRIDVGGTLSARGSAGAGGLVETSAAAVAIDTGVRVDTRGTAARAGEWLIDPTDFVVSAGSGAQTDSGIGATTLANALKTSNVTLQTAESGSEAGDIRVEAAVSWSADTTLTLSAVNDILINANLTATGNSAGLTISAGSGRYVLGDGAVVTLSGSSPALSINGTPYIVVNSLAALQAINTDSNSLALSYALGSDIDASATATWNDGAGFVPIGDNSYYYLTFRGNFDGLGHQISGLTINRPGSDYTGLFGYAQGSSLRNLTLAGGSIVGGTRTGALVGYHYGYGVAAAGIENVHSDVPVSAVETSGSVFVGGLVGQAEYLGAITRSSAAGDVFGDGSGGYAGGLAGYMYQVGALTDSSASGDVTRVASGYSSTSGETGGLAGTVYYTTVARVSASGAVSGGDLVGGLFGRLYGNTTSDGMGGTAYLNSLTDASATGDVVGNDGSSYVGGLIGLAYYMPMTDVSASGSVGGGDSYTGGLVGSANYSAITRGSAGGDVTGSGSYAGGLVGYASRSAIHDSDAAGTVTTTGSYAGGLVGYVSISDIADSRASGDVTAGSTAGGLVGGGSMTADGGRISGSRASGKVVGGYTAGGLIGDFSATNYTEDEHVAISDSHASGAVRARSSVGGLIGSLDSVGVVIEDNSATGTVTGTGVDGETASLYLGGLIGQLYDTTYYYGSAPSLFRRNFATGAVAVTDTVAAQYAYVYAGGLIGEMYTYGAVGDQLSIVDSHSDSPVALRASGGYAYVGGLIGYAYGGAVDTSYASGAISATGFGSVDAGGLVGQYYGGAVTPVTRSYWNAERTGQATSSGGGTGLSDVQMRTASSFVDWDLSGSGGAATVWRIYEGLSQPLLRDQLTPLALALGSDSKAYDGSASLAGTSYTAVGGGTIEHPEAILVGGLSPHVGSTVVGASSLYSTPGGYDLTASGSGTLSIVPRVITLDGMVADKVYDRSTAGSFVPGAQPTGLVAGEDLTIGLGSATATFSNRNAGVDKAVTVSGYTVGNGTVGRASDYTVVGSATADITPKTVTAGSFTAVDRDYDGSTSVDVGYTAAALSGVIAGDAVSLSGTTATGTLADKHAGVDREVTVSGITLTGADAGNYLLGGIDAVTVTINPKAVTVNGLTTSDRQYNGSTTVSVNGSAATLAGVLAGDQVVYSTRSLTGTMADRHAGTDKAVTVSGLTLAGLDAGDYAPVAADLTVTITPRTVTGYMSTLYNSEGGGYGYKLYDGSADASGVAYVYGSGLIGGDGVEIGAASIVFGSKNVAYSGSAVANQTITGSGFVLTGENAGDYALSNTSSTTTGRIVPRALTVSGVAAVDRVYDGSVDVVVNIDGAEVDASQLVSGDDVSITVPGGGAVTGTMANKNVGTNKAVSVPGLALSGADALNYTLTGSSGVTVDITRKELTAQYVGQDKVYDGTTRATAVASSTDVVAGDNVTFYTNLYGNGYCAGGYYTCYANFTGDGAKNVGDGKTIAISYEYLYGSDAGNYLLVGVGSATTTGSITPRPITPSVTGVDKVYDGTAAATVTLNAAASGIVGADVVAIGTSDAVFTGAGAKNVGTGKAVSVSGITLSGTDAFNYSLASDSAATTASITPKPVSVTGITAANRVYDGTLVVSVTADMPSVSGLIAGDDVGAVLPVGGITSGTMADRHAGEAKPFSVTGVSLTGTDAGNYTLAGSGGTVDIAPKSITVSYTGIDKVYDGTVTASVTGMSGGIVDGVGDVVGFAQTAVFTGSGAKNAGTDKAIAVSGITLTGANAGNYVLASDTASASADITPKTISVSYVGVNRVYNGTADTSATVLGTASGLIAGDSVGLNQTARFAPDGNAGSGKTVNISDISLAGVNAGNYALTSTTATTTASILPRSLGVAGMTAVDRGYDGTTTVQVNVSGASVDLTGVISGDDVTVSLPPEGITTGEMADRHVGVDKAVSITGLLLGGAAAGNYTLTGDDALTVTITPMALTATWTGVDKIYDGGIAASVIGSATFFAGDSVGLSASGTFTGGRNVGSDKAVSVVNGLLTGADRRNYTLANPTGSTTADITPRTVTAVYTGGTRVYDGTVAAPVTGALSNAVYGDELTLAQTAVFTGAGAKNVGDAKPISVSGITLGGADVGNYVLAGDSAAATGSVTPRPVVIEGLSGIVATDRVYDGTTAVAVIVPSGLTGTPRAGDILSGESVVVDLPAAGATTGHMADKNVGTGKAVLVDGLGLSGTDAGNYMIAEASGVTVDISRLTISAVYAGVDKVYDGSSIATVTVSLPGMIAGDALTGSATGLFTGGKNAGLDKAIAVTGGLLAGADAGNYLLSNASGSTSADITPKTVTALYAGGTRAYDGTTTAPVTGTVSGLIGGDTIALSQSAVFADGKNVGTGKLINVSAIALGGTDAGNYALSSTTAVTSGSVTPRAVVVEGLTVTADGREYDGTTAVTVHVSAAGGAGARPGDLIAGDDVTLLLPPTGDTTGHMADKNAGTGKAIVVDGLGLSGADAANYMVVGTSGLTVDIAQRTLTATWAGVDREYDGTALATARGSGDRVVAGDDLLITGSGLFDAGRNAGTGLAISIDSAVLGGADAANYVLSNPTGSATASITPRTLTVSYVGGTRIYDGTTAAPVTGSFAGLVDGDVVSLTQTAVFTGAGAKNVGDGKAVSVTGIALAGSDAGNYRSDIASTTTTASITPRPVVIEGLSASATSREYDGTAVVSVALVAAGGVAPRPGDLISGDDVSVNVPATGSTFGTMADKNVGSGKAVVIDGLGLSGADAANYRIEGVDGVTVDITPRTLTAVWTGVDKVYDGTDAGTANGVGDRTVAGDDLVLVATGTFTAGRNAGTGLTMAFSGVALSGADAGNYTLLNPDGSVTASILPRTVTAVYAGVDKVYDGSDAATVTATLDNVVDGDTLTLTQSAVFTGGKNVGTDKAVLVGGIALGGADAGNYVLASNEASTTATITPKSLTVTGLGGLTAVDREYDGTRTVALTGTAAGSAAIEGLVGGDDVTLTVAGGSPTQGTMLDKHVGAGKGVVVDGLALSGADAVNYVLAETLGLTVTITPRTVTAAGLAAVDRAYDGTTVVALDTSGASLSGVVAGDDLQLRLDGATAGMADKHVGTGKAVTLDGAALQGADVGDYLLVSADALRVNITPRLLTATYVGVDKVYDGTASATVTITGTDIVDGDDLSVVATGTFTGGKNVGAGKAITIADASLSGTDASNYLLLNPDGSATASITPRTLTAVYSGGSRVYDGTTAATVSATLDGAIDGDLLTVSQTAAFADRNAGVGKTVTVSAIELGGDDAGNYVLAADSATTTATITPRTLSLSASAADKTYDGSTAASVSYGDDRIAGDVFTVGHGSAVFADKNAGAGKAVTVSGLVLTGDDAGNYMLDGDTLVLSADIDPRALTLSARALEKLYGNALPGSGSLFDASGLVAGETVGRVTYASAGAGAGANVGSYVLTIGGASGGSFDPANYVLSYRAAALLVNPRPLTLTALTRSKTYGDALGFGGTEFTTNDGGLANGDTIGSVGLSSAGALASAGVGRYTIAIGGASGGTFSASNYAITYEAGTLNVDPRPLTIATRTVVRYADEPNPASFGFSTSQGGLVNGDLVASVLQGVPAGSIGAPGGSVFELLPSGALFGSGDASNYEISYRSGLLIVLPKPPRIDDADGGTAGGGDPQFAIVLDPADLARAEEALRRSSAANAGAGSGGGGADGATSGDGEASDSDAQAAAVIAALLRGETQQVSLPVLLRLPLISMDPNLRRLILGAVTTP